jgi:hypothetical protein
MVVEPDHDLIELGRRFRDAFPVAAPWKAWTTALSTLDPVADEIRDSRATTPKGLAIKAEVLAWRVAASSHGPSVDLESSYDHLFSLIRAVFEVAGEPLPGFVAEALRWRP